MKKLLFLLLLIFCYHDVVTAQDDIEFERPFNFFASAGASARMGKAYDVTISPVDYTVQFEKIFPILTRFSMGLVWNPLRNNSEENKQEFMDKSAIYEKYEANRKHLAIALLVNIFQLSFTAEQVNASSLIDVGFGLGYRKDNFLIMGTLEFTPLRKPRSYFVETYEGKNKQLILAGAQEPVRTISTDDNSLFITTISPSMGVKIAYAFSKKKELKPKEQESK